jgi:outer membrane protein assembly factor BamB
MKFLSALVVTTLCTSLPAEEWSRYRGPNGTGISEDSGVVTEWDSDKNLKWKVALPGAGSSSPIVSKGKAFVASYSGYGAEGGSVEKLERHLTCIDQQSGKIEWTKSVKARLPEDPYSGFLTEHGYASSTPVADGERVYVFFGKSGVFAYDFSGVEQWSKHLGSESTGKRWGSAASPILVGKYLIVNAAEESRAIFALDKITGEEVWKAEADALAYAYSTPSMLVRKDALDDLVLPVPGELWGLDPETGKLRWWVETGISGNVSPSAIFSDDLAFVYGGYPRTARVAVKTTGKDEIKDAIVWEETKSSYIPTPVLSDGHLYWVSDSGDAMCANASTGKLIYQERLDGAQGGNSRGKPFYASPVLAGGNYYAVSRNGGTFVIKATPTFELVAHNKIASDKSQFNATPAIGDGDLFLRSDSMLYCVGAK